MVVTMSIGTEVQSGIKQNNFVILKVLVQVIIVS